MPYSARCPRPMSRVLWARIGLVLIAGLMAGRPAGAQVCSMSIGVQYGHPLTIQASLTPGGGDQYTGVVNLDGAQICSLHSIHPSVVGTCAPTFATLSVGAH